MADEVDDRLTSLLAEVARRHGVSLSKDDPILIIETLHARAVNDLAAHMEKELQKFRQGIEAALTSFNKQVESTTEKAINATVERADKIARERMAVGVEKQLVEIRSQVQRDIEAPISNAIARLLPYLNRADNVSRLNIMASGMSLLAVAAALWLFFHSH